MPFTLPYRATALVTLFWATCGKKSPSVRGRSDLNGEPPLEAVQAVFVSRFESVLIPHVVQRDLDAHPFQHRLPRRRHRQSGAELREHRQEIVFAQSQRRQQSIDHPDGSRSRRHPVSALEGVHQLRRSRLIGDEVLAVGQQVKVNLRLQIRRFQLSRATNVEPVSSFAGERSRRISLGFYVHQRLSIGRSMALQGVHRRSGKESKPRLYFVHHARSSVVIDRGRFCFPYQALDEGTEKARGVKGIVQKLQFVSVAQLQNVPKIPVDVVR